MKYKQFGYNNLGPLLLGFSNWLFSNIKREGIDRIYFFSRDGFIMKRAFAALYQDLGIETYYLEVSRRSLRVPILWKDYSFENILTMLGPSQLITLKSIFDCVGIELCEHKDLIIQYGFNENSYFKRDNIRDNHKLQLLYKSLSDEINSNSLKEYELLKKYILQNKLGGKFAIVDIGWSGGMQRFLQTILNEMNIKADIYGYYTGVADYYTRNVSSNHDLKLNGYLFDFSHHPNDVDVRSCFVGLYEMLFLEQKGSVKYYREKSDGTICALRYDYEYLVDGKLLKDVVCISEVQDGAIEFVKNNKSNNFSSTELLKMVNPLLKSGQWPSKEAMELFSNFRFVDEGEYTVLANPRSMFYYLFHIGEFKIDFLKCRWKTAFLRKIFHIPFPYYLLYDFLKK